MTYDILLPYLKGFHLALSNHLPQRDDEGWKMNDDAWNAYLHNKYESDGLSSEVIHNLLQKETSIAPPQQVTPVPLFHTCLTALSEVFKAPSPPLVTDRSATYHLALYGFVDASKQGFGVILEGHDGVRYRVGTWGSDSENDSSNWREFSNLVDTIEYKATHNELHHSILVIASDNTTVEHCFYKGNSSSPKLYQLIVRLRSIELTYGLKLYLTHVSGERMKKQGTDVLSQGHFKEGVCLGEIMLKYCPWGKFAYDRAPLLGSWIKDWLPNHCYLTPKDWFIRSHDLDGGYDDSNNHWNIVLVPKLFTHLWKKQMIKCCDFVFGIAPVHKHWSSNQLESLTLGICFPFLSHRPWQLRHTPKLFSLEREMSRLFKSNNVDRGNILRKLLQQIKSWYSMSPSVLWAVLYFQKRSCIPRHECDPENQRCAKRQRQNKVRKGMEEKTPEPN